MRSGAGRTLIRRASGGRRSLHRLIGLGRSLMLYYGDPGLGRRTRRFYAQFVGPSALCFDLGAHVGNRTWAWWRLGARVVAVEPQPDFARFLGVLFRWSRRVTVLPVAVSDRAGTIVLKVSSRTPTVTTASPAFIAETTRVASFAWVRWDTEVPVRAVTLDDLVARYGTPDFVKIDVEGMEGAVLAGLSRPLPRLSFEFVPSSLSSALRSLDRLQAIGAYEFNVSLGETMRFAFAGWVDPASLRAWLLARDPTGDSGDVYARLHGGLRSAPGQVEEIEVAHDKA